MIAVEDMPVVAADETPIWDELTAEYGDPRGEETT